MTIEGIICDIDGVLEYQGHVLARAPETIQALRNQGLMIRFLTNSTLKSRIACASRLREHGFQVLDEEVFTASYLTAEYLRRSNARSCWAMVDGSGSEEFREFTEDRENPEYVVVGDNRSCFDFEHLNKALRAVLRGAKLIGMQPELLDTSQGEMELNVGSWAGMLERAAGVQATYIGKPNAFAFEVPLESMNVPRQHVVMIGDQLPTDIAGAQVLAMRTILVRAGEFRRPDNQESIQPDFVVDDIGQVNEILRGL